MIFREQLKWGATAVISSWYLVLSGVLAGGGMALLAIGAVFFLGLKEVQLSTLLISVVALLALAVATNWVASHPHFLERWLRARLRAFNRWRNKPADRFEGKLVGLAEQLSTVQLPLPQLAISIVVSLAKWILEIFCLLACIYAVEAEPPIAGVVLSFLTAKLVVRRKSPRRPGAGRCCVDFDFDPFRFNDFRAGLCQRDLLPHDQLRRADNCRLDCLLRRAVLQGR